MRKPTKEFLFQSEIIGPRLSGRVAAATNHPHYEKSGNYESLDLESKEEVKDLVDIEKENGMKQPMLKIRVSMGF